MSETLRLVGDDLSDLVTRIEVEHTAVGRALQSALEHAIAAGELLIEAKRQVKRGWLFWLAANCSIPERTVRHYMALAERRASLTNENGNVLPISVRQALNTLRDPYEVGSHRDGSGSEWGEYQRWEGWGRLAWRDFGEALQTVTQLPKLNPPAPRYVVKAAREGKTPGLTAASLREAISLLARYAEALDDNP